MHQQDSYTDLGAIKIHKNVLASIAAIAAAEIEGVKHVGGDFKSGILEFIGQKEGKGIKVDIDKNEEVRIGIPLVIKFGHNIPDVANKVQENVRVALEKMTNISVKDIDITIQAIEK